MDYKKLVEKYWQGETTLEEEKTLRAHFSAKDTTPESPSLSALFSYFEQEQKKELKPRVEEWVANPTARVRNLSNRPLFRYRNLRIAAAILFLIIAGLGIQKYLQLTDNQDISQYWADKEVKDPKEAYRKTRAALLLMSSKLNKGAESAIHQVAKVQKIKKVIR